MQGGGHSIIDLPRSLTSEMDPRPAIQRAHHRSPFRPPAHLLSRAPPLRLRQLASPPWGGVTGRSGVGAVGETALREGHVLPMTSLSRQTRGGQAVVSTLASAALHTDAKTRGGLPTRHNCCPDEQTRKCLGASSRCL